jgi:hypothetical protein
LTSQGLFKEAADLARLRDHPAELKMVALLITDDTLSHDLTTRWLGAMYRLAGGPAAPKGL